MYLKVSSGSQTSYSFIELKFHVFFLFFFLNQDLGPQIAWKTVFLVEYAGPLIVYAWIYQRPWIFYGDEAVSQPMNQIVQ